MPRTRQIHQYCCTAVQFHTATTYCCHVHALGLRKFPHVCLPLWYSLDAKSLINDILALRKRLPASSLPHDRAKCSRGPKKDESSPYYDGGGIDPPDTTPSPVLSTVSPSSSSSSEGSSTTCVLLALAINELFLFLQPCPSLNSVGRMFLACPNISAPKRVVCFAFARAR